ncbi:MAG: CCA tRNA nucleotidyltransferase [Candidatus Nitronauta litoralis]|uniref:CCA tRNA nucleotidyltransferase n=1 Tax=Candidatus Nitronauta litoralis TaxID=2705533 RepID=A0A7T0BSX1_9BACT|nr:MAG: CCA tRNA nucleotidyltransferase [Candidatus Nitronauta litoralis]
MRQLMQEQLPAATRNLLDRVAVLATKNDFHVYVVGGFVRDLLLQIKNLDIDLVVEGDGLRFAELLGSELNAKITPHTRFGTSVLDLEDGSHLDVATARLEIYKEPAALPTVQPGSIREDMGRRDFSINSLAIKLEPEGCHLFLDFNQGKLDLEQKVIRALHPKSFVDDPTRIFRAIRFEQRLGFALNQETKTWLVAGIPVIEKLSGHRLFNELVAIFMEKDVTACLWRLQELGVIKGIDPEIYWEKVDWQKLERLGIEANKPENRVSIGEVDQVFIWLLGMLWSLDEKVFLRVLDRFGLKGGAGEKLIKDREYCISVLDKFEESRPVSSVEVYETFSSISIEAAYWLLAVSENKAIGLGVDRYFSYIKEASHVSLTGDDLISLGLKPGPLFQKVFQELCRGRLEGKIHSREDEKTWVREKYLTEG